MVAPSPSKWLVAAVVLTLGGLTACDPGADEPAVNPPASASADPSRSASSAESRSAKALLALPRTAGRWPGENGLSGVNGDPILDYASVKQFCTARGRPCKVAHTYTDRTTYQTMTSGSPWTFDFFKDFPGALVISQGLAPNGGEADVARCAAGDFDEQWRNFGNLMVAHGRGDSVVRLGWELNEATMAWRGIDTQAYIACYRNAADNIRAVNPDVILDWSINAHGTPAGLCDDLSTNCYPGDEYVDIIGIDNYDHYPWSETKADFTRTADAPEGITWLYKFAQQHGKPFSVGEWGVVPTGDAGKENPNFIRWMHEWFATHAEDLAYEAYFSDCGAGGVQSSLYNTAAGCIKNPGSAEVYRELWTE